MARTAVPIYQGELDAAVEVTPVTADATNEMQIDLTVPAEKVLVYLAGDSTNTITYTFLAGDGSLASQGDLEVAVAVGEFFIVELESARFKDTDGLILIDVAGTVVTATVAAVAVA